MNFAPQKGSWYCLLFERNDKTSCMSKGRGCHISPPAPGSMQDRVPSSARFAARHIQHRSHAHPHPRTHTNANVTGSVAVRASSLYVLLSLYMCLLACDAMDAAVACCSVCVAVRLLLVVMTRVWRHRPYTAGNTEHTRLLATVPDRLAHCSLLSFSVSHFLSCS